MLTFHDILRMKAHPRYGDESVRQFRVMIEQQKLTGFELLYLLNALEQRGYVTVGATTIADNEMAEDIDGSIAALPRTDRND